MKVILLPIRLALGLSLVLVLGCFITVDEPVSSSQLPLALENPTPYPEPNSHTALPSTTISITYDEAIDPTSVTTETFAIHAMQTGLLTQTYGIDGGTVTLTPIQPLKPGEVVQASATTGLLSLVDGQGPSSSTVWSFRVATGEAQGFFVDSGQLLGSSDSYAVALGDLDGDGDLDAFVGGYYPYTDQPRPDEVWLNNGGLQGGTPGTYIDSGQRLGEARSQSVALGDLDGDGDLDAFVANGGHDAGEANQVWLNDGGGIFEAGQSLGDLPSVGAALADLDGDGDLDAWVANGGPANTVWLNEGNAVFVDSGQLLWTVTMSLAVGDVDGDGDVDAITGTYRDHHNIIWLNDGLGGFVDSGNSLGTAMVYSVALGDLDEDGDLDAIAATEAQAARVWLNDGTGVFSDSGQHLGNSASGRVTLGDVDGDGDIDAIIQHQGAEKVWLNDGAGVFEASGQGSDSGSTLSSISMEAMALGDVDGDDDLDIFGVRCAPNRVWLNRNPFEVTAVSPPNGAASVVASTAVIATLDSAVDAGSVNTETFAVRGSQTGVYNGTYSIHSLQFDPAQDFKAGEEIWVNLSQGISSTEGTALVPYAWSFRAAAAVAPGTFMDSGQRLGDSISQAVALGDLDGDGDLDAFVTNYDPYIDMGRPNKVWLNNGGLQGGRPGTYTDSGQSLGTGRSRDVALGDLDADGDLDAFVVNGGHNVGEVNRVWLNDGTGAFQAGQSLGDTNSRRVALSDLDGDGDLDAWVANSDPVNRIWLNDGNAVFVDSGQMPGTLTLALAMGDIDGDGDVDAIAGTYAGPNIVWLNDGLGVFVDGGGTLGSVECHDVTIGDVDGDGDLDAVASTETQATRIWLNDGSGSFADSGQALGTTSAGDIALGDVDGDGDLDIFIQQAGLENLWLNDGMGIFGAGDYGLSCSDLWAAAPGDVDGDGDLDVFGARYGANKVCLNLVIHPVFLPLVLRNLQP